DGAVRLVVVGDHVQDRHEQYRDRPAQVEHGFDVRMAEDPLRVAQVLLDHRGVPVASEDRPAVRHRDRVDVDVHHPRVRCGLPGHLVHVAQGRDAGTDVEELAYPGVDQVLHGAPQEGAVGVRLYRYVGHGGDRLTGELAVGGEVVRAAEQVVVDACGAGLLH